MHYGSFSPPHRFRECFDTEAKLQRLNKRRDISLEDEASRLFLSVIDADVHLQSYYIPIGTEGGYAERDLLILKDGCLFLIESKARALRPVGLRHDKLARIKDDVKRTIQEGYNQACDVIRYLKNKEGPIPFFNSNRPDRKVLTDLNPAEIHEIIPIVFLDSYYGFIASDLKPWIISDKNIGFPWVVDRDTFESILMKVDTFQKLKTFLLWRRELHGLVLNEDEAVFAGAFLRHGSFQIPKKADKLYLPPDYADVFEAEYFRRKGFDVEMPPENTGPPVFTSMQKNGDELVQKINGRVHQTINLNTGKIQKRRSSRRQHSKPGHTGRNDPCPCNSGQKYKKCCM